MEETKTLQKVNSSPIVSSFNHQIRPLLDAIDKLRHLNIMKEGIQLPTIVVVGDQSSGKSSVLESLADINLPRGYGICTRVPLIMRLQHHSAPTPILTLEYLDKSVPTDETNVAESIESATLEIAGSEKGVSDTPLTLVVKKHGVPDLTMVDLPGITRVAVNGQPDNIYEQIHDMIMHYITPVESIILNVLSAGADFSTYESIRMSQEVDKSGERTLAVVTKVDKAPEGLLEKVRNNEVRIGLGYVCVRNRIGNETYEQARAEEAALFQSHLELSKMEKSIVGVPALAEKLTAIQASSIAKCLPEIVKQINEKLNASMGELNKLPDAPSSTAEATSEFVRIMGSSKESLRKIFVRGEYEEYPDVKEMHCAARLAEFLDDFSNQLKSQENAKNDEHFLEDMIEVLEEAKGIWLPDFVPRASFLDILQKKLTQMSALPEDFASKVWDYVGKIVLSVLGQHSENYPQLQLATRRVAQNLILKMKSKTIKRVKEMIEMEKKADYTSNPEYMVVYNKLMAYLPEFTEKVTENYNPPINHMNIEGIGRVGVVHLRKYKEILQQAFGLNMRVTAYWKIVMMRMVDYMALHLLLSINNLVGKEFENVIISELMGGDSGLDKLLVESSAVAHKREKLRERVELLKESKDVVADMMDGIAVN